MKLWRRIVERLYAWAEKELNPQTPEQLSNWSKTEATVKAAADRKASGELKQLRLRRRRTWDQFQREYELAHSSHKSQTPVERMGAQVLREAQETLDANIQREALREPSVRQGDGKLSEGRPRSTEH